MSTGHQMIDAAISAGNFNLALQLIEKKIQQQPNSSHNLASKCYILANSALSPDSKVTGEQALKECVNLASKVPSDPKTLNLLDSSFHMLDYKPKDDLYEAAVRKYSTPSLVYEWFKRTVELNDILGLQKSTMALSKSFKANTENGRMIKFWAAASMNIAIECCKQKDRLSGGKDRLLAALGLKIIENIEAESKVSFNAQEVYVKCQLLLKKGDTEKCLDELKSFLEKESDLELLLIYFEQLKNTGKWQQLYDSTINYLVKVGVDDWDTWKLAILASKNLDKTDEMYQIISSYKVGRNSQLAMIEWIDEADVTAKLEALTRYLNLYMHKLCCYLDLETFLKSGVIPDEKIFLILEEQFKCKDLESVVSGERTATENDLNRLVNYVKIKACLSKSLLTDPEFFSLCCQYYKVTRHLEKKLEDFDYYSGFEFLILALESYLMINRNDLNFNSVLNIIIILENASEKNKYEFHLKLWLAKLYKKTNLSAPLKQIYDSLSIKNVQIDTLGPHFMNKFSSKTRIKDLISSALRFYSHNVAMELPQMVMACFENSTFSKLQGFIEFKLRVENSLTHFDLVLQNIQHLRINSENRSIDDIIRDYLPTLKNAYTIIESKGNDVDLKLHENIDTKIIYQCGDHQKHQEIEAFFESPFSGTADEQYIEIAILRELITYDQNSRVWNKYKEKFLTLVKNKGNLQHFSEMEKYILKVMTWLLDNKPDTNVPEVPKAPTNVLAAECNNYYLSLLDLERILFAINKRSSSTTFFGDKKKKSQLNKAQNYVKSICRKIPRDDLLITTKESLKLSADESEKWFENDEFGKQFDISKEFIKKMYKKLESEALKSIKEI